MEGYVTRNIGADIVVLEQESLFDNRKVREMGELGKLMADQFLSLLSYVAAQERKKILCRMSPSTFYRRVEEWKEELR